MISATTKITKKPSSFPIPFYLSQFIPRHALSQSLLPSHSSIDFIPILAFISLSFKTNPTFHSPSFSPQKACYTILKRSLRFSISASMIDESLLVIRIMRHCGYVPSLSALDLLFRLVHNLEMWDLGFSLFKDMLAMGPRPDVVTFNSFIHAFCRRGLFRQGFAMLGLIERFSLVPDSCSFTILIKACSSTGRSKDAFEVFDLMLQRGTCKPNVITYSILIDTLCREGKLEEAVRLFNRMQSENIKYDTKMYTVLISGYVKFGNIEKANELYREMTSRGLVPDCHTFSVLLSGYDKFSLDWKMEREQLFKHMLSLEVLSDDVMFDMLISSYCSNNQMGEACKFIQRAVEDGILLDTSRFNSIIAAYCRRGFYEDALKVYNIMIDVGVHPSTSTFNSLLIGLFKLGRLDEAQAFFDKMVERRTFVNLLSYTVSVDGYFKAGDVEKARIIWGDIERHGLKPDVVAYSAYISGLCRANCMNEALDAYNEMSTRGVIPNNFVYRLLIAGLRKGGFTDEAMKIKNEMMQRD